LAGNESPFFTLISGFNFVKRTMEFHQDHFLNGFPALSEQVPFGTFRLPLRPSGKVEIYGEFVRDLIGDAAGTVEPEGLCLFGAQVPPEDREVVAKAISSAVESGQPYRVVYRLQHRNGTTRYVLEVGVPVKGDRDGAGRIEGILVDVTVWERRIAQQRQFLNDILEALTHPFLVINAEDYTLELANSASRRTSTPDALHCYALTHLRDTPCNGGEHPCPLALTRKSGRPVIVEHIHYNEQGRPRNVEVHGYPIFDREGKMVKMIEYCLYITDRKRAEAVAWERLKELEQWENLTVSRELKMIELKKQIKVLQQHLAELEKGDQTG
jgi:PAS domain-containing protein